MTGAAPKSFPPGVLPNHSEYSVTPVPALHTNGIEVPVKVVPGAGLLIVASKLASV